MAADRAQILITAVDQTRQALATVKGNLENLASAASKVNGVLAGLGAALSVGALVAAGKAAIDTADNLAKMAQKTGLSVESLSLLKPIAEQSGSSLDGLAKGIQKLSVSMADAASGSKEPAEAFAAMGVSATDAAGKLRPTEDVLLDLATAFASMPDGADKSALAMNLFGKAGVELIPFLNQGRSGIEALKDKFRELGLEVSTKTAKDAEKFNDTMDDVTQGINAVALKIGSAALPALQTMANVLQQLAAQSDAIISLMRVLGEVAVAVFAVKLMGAITTAGGALAALTAAFLRFLPVLIAVGLWEAGSGYLRFRKEMGDLNAEMDKFARRDAQVRQLDAAMQELAINGTLSVATQLDMAKQAADRMQAALPGITDALKTIGQQAAAAGEAIRKGLDEEVKKAAETLKSLGASYTAVTNDIKGIRDAQLAEIERSYKQQAEAAKLAGASEREQIKISGDAFLAMEKARRDAIDESSKKMLDAWKTTYGKAVELAKKAGLDTTAIEQKAAQDRLAIYTQIEAGYRATVDKLIAEENRLTGEINKIQGDIVTMHQDTDLKIREIGRSLMTDEQARADKRLQLETLLAQAKNALAQGNFSEAQKLAQQAMALAIDTANSEAGEFKKSRDAMKDAEKLRTEAAKKDADSRAASLRGEFDEAHRLQREAMDLRTQARVQDARNQQDMQGARAKTAEAIGKVRDAETLLADSMQGTKSALEEQRTAVAESASSAEKALQDISAAVTDLRTELATSNKLKLEFDVAAANESVEKIGALIEAKEMQAIVTADIAAATAAIEQLKTDTDNKEFLANVVAKTEAAESSVKDFQDSLTAAGINMPAKIEFTAAMAEVKRFRQDAELVLKAPTESEHTPKANMAEFDEAVRKMNGTETQSKHIPVPDSSQVNAEFDRLNNMVTHSTHIIHTVQGNAAGGLIQRFAEGGRSIASGFRRMAGRITGPGTETSDSVPALLSHGEYVIRAASVRKFGDGFFAALNAGFMPGVPRFAGGGMVAQVAQHADTSRAQARDTIDLRFNIGGQQHTVQSSRQTAMQLAGALRELSRGA